MRTTLSIPTVDRSLSVAIALQLRNGQHSAPCRLEQMAAEVALVSRSRQAVLGALLDATLATARRGGPAFRAVWVNEAMNRAYTMIRLTALLEKFAPLDCLDVTAGEAERRIASEVAGVLRSVDVDDDELTPCSEALMTVGRSLIELFAPAAGSLCFTADIARLSLPHFKCRALVLASCELISGLLLRGFSQSARGHITVTLSKRGQREVGLTITGSGLGTMCEPFSESLADLRNFSNLISPFARPASVWQRQSSSSRSATRITGLRHQSPVKQIQNHSKHIRFLDASILRGNSSRQAIRNLVCLGAQEWPVSRPMCRRQ
jgi:hypothetical protein